MTDQPFPAPTDYPDGYFATQENCIFPGLVQLDVRTVANRIERAFPLDIQLEVDECWLTIGRQAGLFQRLASPLLGGGEPIATPIRLRVRLQHCYVRYQCQGVTIPTSSKYRSAVEIGTYSDRRNMSDTTASTQDVSGNAGFGAKAGSKENSLSAEAGFRSASQWQGRVTTERVIAATRDIYEVEAVPGGWRIGDKVFGDPVKDGGLLDGPYFARKVEGHPHSCMVQFPRGTSDGAILLDVTTRDGLRVEREDGTGAPLSERESAVLAMKDRMAALCIETAERQSLSEVILASVSVRCSTAHDAEEMPL